MPPLLLKKLAIVILVLAFIGFLDATYLTAKHYHDAIPPCGLVAGCETVLTSKYNNLFGVPVALFGSLYYLAIFFGAFTYLNNQGKTQILGSVAHASWLGFMMSLYFVSLQLFVIKNICLYCMFSALISTTIFILGQIILRRIKNFEWAV